MKTAQELGLTEEQLAEQMKIVNEIMTEIVAEEKAKAQKTTTYIIDNGKIYSSHRIFFVETNASPALVEAVIAVTLAPQYYTGTDFPAERNGGIVGTADQINWQQPPRTMPLEMLFDEQYDYYSTTDEDFLAVLQHVDVGLREKVVALYREFLSQGK